MCIREDIQLNDGEFSEWFDRVAMDWLENDGVERTLEDEMVGGEVWNLFCVRVIARAAWDKAREA